MALPKELSKLVCSFVLSGLPQYLANKDNYPDTETIKTDLTEFLTMYVGSRIVKSCGKSMKMWTKGGTKKLSGYNLFTQENNPKIRKEHSEKLGKMTQQEKFVWVNSKNSSEWNVLPDEQKLEYKNRAKQLSENNPEQHLETEKKTSVKKEKNTTKTKTTKPSKVNLSVVKKNNRYHLVVGKETTNYLVINPKNMTVCAKLSANDRQIKLSQKDIEKIKDEYKLKIGNTKDIPSPVSLKKSPPKQHKKKEPEEEDSGDTEKDVNVDDEESDQEEEDQEEDDQESDSDGVVIDEES